MVTVYVKPSCVQCDATKRMMNKLNIEYQTVDIYENPDALPMLLEKGFQSAPVVMTDDDAWSGFQPDKINKLVEGN